MRTLVLFFILIPLLAIGERVVIRSNDFNIDADQCVTHEMEFPAWSGTSRMVCAKSMSPWEIVVITEAADTLTISFSWRESWKQSFEPVNGLSAVMTHGPIIKEGEITEQKGLRLLDNDYMITFAWDMTRGTSLSCGNNLMIEGVILNSPIRKIFLCSSDGMKFTEWLTRAETLSPLHGRVSRQDMAAAIESQTDSIAGIYRYFDRDTDPSAVIPGGTYDLAVIPIPGSSDYAVCYLHGATVNRELWQPGMVKGIMTPTDFEGQYSLRWLDSEYHEVEAEQYAVLWNGNLLQLNFPLYRSKIRFVKDRHPKVGHLWQE